MASVYGPLEAKIQKELSDRMYIELNYKPKTGMPGKNQHEYFSLASQLMFL